MNSLPNENYLLDKFQGSVISIFKTKFINHSSEGKNRGLTYKDFKGLFPKISIFPEVFFFNNNNNLKKKK